MVAGLLGEVVSSIVGDTIIGLLFPGVSKPQQPPSEGEWNASLGTATATTAAARHSRPGVPAGFAVGAPADFVLLRADPRVDIRNPRQIHGVILRGRLLTRQDLDAMLATIG